MLVGGDPLHVRTFDPSGEDRARAELPGGALGPASVAGSELLARVDVSLGPRQRSATRWSLDLAAQPLVARTASSDLPAWTANAGAIVGHGAALVFSWEQPRRIAEIRTTNVATFDRTWPHDDVFIAAAAHDAARGEWIALARRGVVTWEYPSTTRAAVVVIGADGTSALTWAEGVRPLRSFAGNVALGDGSVGIAFWDFDRPGFVWFLEGPNRTPTRAVELVGQQSPRIVWNPESDSYAVLGNSERTGGSGDVVFRCDVRPGSLD